MKNIKLSPLLFVSAGLILISAGVLGNWAYKKYFKSEETYAGELILLKPVDLPITAKTMGDSIQEYITPSVKKKLLAKKNTVVEDTLIAAAKPDQLTSNKIPSKETAAEINKLKAAIEKLLTNRTNEADLKLAKQKIEELVEKNSRVETENKRLFAVLKKLSDERTETEQATKNWPAVYENKTRVIKTAGITVPANSVPVIKKSTSTPSVSIGKKNDIASPKSTSSATENLFGVEDIRLTAFTVTDNKEIETFQAYQADKLVGSVTVKNSSFFNTAGEIFIVVLQPDGRVLQKSTWESGTFQSPEGKKVYSCRLRFDYNKGETKRLTFSLLTPHYLKGNYIMQVYSKGLLIGKIVRVLS